MEKYFVDRSKKTATALICYGRRALDVRWLPLLVGGAVGDERRVALGYLNSLNVYELIYYSILSP